MDWELQRRFEEYVDAPEARDLPWYQRNSYGRLRALARRELTLVLDAPLPLGFSDSVRLPDGSNLEYLGEAPEGDHATPEIARTSGCLRHRYALRVSLPEVSVEAVRESYRAAATLASLFSLGSEMPVRWRDPQVPDYVHIASRHPERAKAYALLENLFRLPANVQHALEVAAGWYDVAVRIGEPGEMRAYEFLSYWNVVESVAYMLAATPLSREVQTAIRDRLADLLPPDELADVVRALAYRRSLRDRVASAFRQLVREPDATRLTDDLFRPRAARAGAARPSLYSVRNSIAHGRLAGASPYDDPLAADTAELHDVVRDLLMSAAGMAPDCPAMRES